MIPEAERLRRLAQRATHLKAEAGKALCGRGIHARLSPLTLKKPTTCARCLHNQRKEESR